MSYFACHVEKFKSNDVRGIQIHNQRESENSKNKDIDTTRTELNFDLHNTGKINYNKKVKEIIAEGYKGNKALRKDATVLTSTIVTSDKEFFDNMTFEKQKEFFQESYNFLKDLYGEKNIVSAVIHFDESTPHMHLTAVPLTQDGRLSAKNVIDRNTLRHIQKAIPELLNEKGFDIQRGIEGSNKNHEDTNEYKRKKELKMMKEIIELRKEVKSLREGIPEDGLEYIDTIRKLNKRIDSLEELIKEKDIIKETMSIYIRGTGVNVDEANKEMNSIRNELKDKLDKEYTSKITNGYEMGE